MALPADILEVLTALANRLGRAGRDREVVERRAVTARRSDGVIETLYVGLNRHGAVVEAATGDDPWVPAWEVSQR